MTTDPPEQHPAVRAVAVAMAAYETGDLDTLAGLVHPDAEIEMLALGGDVARGPDGLREALERARDAIHRPTMTSIVGLGDDAALMIGRIQYSDARGALTDRKAVWLTVLRNGLVWRSHVFATEQEAEAYYLAERETRVSQ